MLLPSKQTRTEHKCWVYRHRNTENTVSHESTSQSLVLHTYVIWLTFVPCVSVVLCEQSDHLTVTYLVSASSPFSWTRLNGRTDKNLSVHGVENIVGPYSKKRSKASAHMLSSLSPSADFYPIPPLLPSRIFATRRKSTSLLD